MLPLHRGPGGRLSALALTLLLIVTGTVALQLRDAAPASASPDGTAAPGRIAYGGTLHRSIGVLDPGDTGHSAPLFPGGPQHHDDEVSARADAVVWTSLRDSARPQVYLQRGDGPPVRLTDDAEGVRHPVLSPDGTRVAFAASTGRADGGRDIWVTGTGGNGDGTRRLTDGLGENTWPTWSPDGGRIAFSGQRTADGGWQIYRVPSAGGAIVQLTDDAIDEEAARTEVIGNTQPSWDPDPAHDRILFTCHHPSRYGDEPARLKWIPAGGSLGGTGTELLPGQDSRQGTWSPDGTAVAFVSHTPPGGYPAADTLDRVFTVAVDASGTAGPRELRLEENRLVATPAWHTPPGGATRLLVTRTSAGTADTMNLMDVRPDGSDPRDLQVPLRHLGQDRSYGYDLTDVSQQYSPDGRSLAFTRVDYEDGFRRSRVWIAGADGSDPRPLPDHTALDTTSTGFPAWSPDGTRIALTRSCLPCRPGGQIAVVEVATGRQIHEVPSTLTQSDSEAAYSGDGATLLFTRQDLSREGVHTRLWAASAADGSGQRDFTAVDDPQGTRTRDSHPAYTPDGTALALVAGGRLTLLGADGTGPRPVPDPQGLCGPGSAAAGHCADPAWSPDGSRLVAGSRTDAAATVYDPHDVRHHLAVVDRATGAATRITGAAFRGAPGDDGQQVAPTWQHTSDLGTELLTPPEPVTVGGTGTFTLTVTNRGPATVPGAELVITVPEGLRPATARPGTGTCAADLRCALGTLVPGQAVPVEVTVPGTAPGTFPVGWTVTGTLPDPDPSDNEGRVEVAVVEPEPEPTPTPTPSPTPSAPPQPSPGPEPEPSPTPPPADPPRPGPVPPAPAPPPGDSRPDAGPGLRITLTPDPAYAGGRLTASYRLTNGGGRQATGLRVQLTLPRGVPVTRRPAGCDAALRCPVADLAPGASAEVRVVLTPRAAGLLRFSGRLTTTGTDTTGADNTARRSVRVLQPRIVAVPPIGAPGFVTIVRGEDFPPGVPVRLSWDPGITAAARPVVPAADGTFAGQLLILPNDALGPREITAADARSAGAVRFSPVTTPFLVVDRTPDPPLFDSRNF
ncbi:hypothetical protein V1J52_05020 [Streptomyces sp. TRM 70351]|uniref:hypothetical protein n=1 Tax=Streptomyces sp. TRM 70351 TaxID=3116552 RepID=UPI002E7C239A|nr:hypothetical protein [Streptomyces sp. TRM 70351]MEE1927555.1 hypothetical protein [Streptomyces sp. TRM 70351]